MLTIAHIVNPVRVSEDSDLFIAQPVTFEAMRRAREYAQATCEVRLLTTQYPRDQDIVPEGFQPLADLDRSVLDIGAFRVPRKLPLVRDILDRLYAGSRNADILIYSNVDIAPQPYFYAAISAIAQRGYDAFVINRRTIPGVFTSPSQLELMYAEAGHPHPGYDCFVFRRDLFPKFDLGNACIGASGIGKVLVANLILHGRRFSELRDCHLTFHLGDDRKWQQDSLRDYQRHNMRQLAAIIAPANIRSGNGQHPLLQRFAKQVRDFEHGAGNSKRAEGNLLGRILKRAKPGGRG